MSDDLQNLINRESQQSMGRLIRRGGPSETPEELANIAFVLSQYSSWIGGINKETEKQKISKLGQFPSTGRCDALGRLLVKVPGVSSETLGQFPLVVRAATKSNQERAGDKSSSSRSRVQANSRGRSEKSAPSGHSLTVPDNSGAAEGKTGGQRYTMLSSSSPSMQYSDAEKTTESMKLLTRKAHELRIEPDVTQLELPILNVEYKKASDNMIKGTNQLRMYLTASVKFLKAVGIKNFAVYGVQTDGSIAVVPAAVLRDDGVRNLMI